MKRFEGTIYVECDLCWKKSTWTRTCPVCGHTVCIMCFLEEKSVCSVCGGDFIEPFNVWERWFMKELDDWNIEAYQKRVLKLIFSLFNSWIWNIKYKTLYRYNFYYRFAEAQAQIFERELKFLPSFHGNFAVPEPFQPLWIQRN